MLSDCLAWLSFELDAIRASETVSLRGIRLRLPRSEDLVIYKLVAWRPQDHASANPPGVEAHGRGANEAVEAQVRRRKRSKAQDLHDDAAIK